MNILALESSAVSASAAIVRDGKLLCNLYLNNGLTHSVTLMPLVTKALEYTSLTLADIDVISAAVGPGSFTGIRIGVAAAKGLALKNDIPCIPVSTLEGIAYPLKDSDAVACAVMDARCSQVYNALFSFEDGKMTRLCPDRAISLEELKNDIEKISKRIILIGDGADISYKYLKDYLPNVSKASEIIKYQSAAGIALRAYDIYNETGETCSSFALAPSYLRLSQAERELKKKKEKNA